MYKASLAVLAFWLCGVGSALAADRLTIAVFGRGNHAAMNTAFIEPYAKATGTAVNDIEYEGELDPLINSIRAGKTMWDVIQVETRTLDVGCREGWFEKIDASKIVNKADFVPGSISECGIGIFAWSHVLAYDADKIAGAPKSWADLWDLKKFPGKRGLRRTAKYTLEIALLADGVAPADLYKVLETKEGVDRAFRKLDQIKGDTVWWEAAGQPAVFLAAGKMVMSAAFPPWIETEQRRGRNLKFIWSGSLYDFDNWAIPARSPNIADAYKFIAFASKPERQKAFVQEIRYGPANTKALGSLHPKFASTLPTAPANLKQGFQIDIPFWIKNGAALEQRFRDWAPVLVKQETEEHEHPAPGMGESHEHPH